MAAISVAQGWIDNQWMIALAVSLSLSLSLSLSFAIAAVMNRNSDSIYHRYRSSWHRLQTPHRLPDDRVYDLGGATIVVIGMGGVGTGAYDMMRRRHGRLVVGIDIDPATVASQQAANRHVLPGDPGGADFWDRVQVAHTLQLVMLTLPRLATSLDVIGQLNAASFGGQIAAIARFDDEALALQEAGADIVFNIYEEAGGGFASHVLRESPASATTAATPASADVIAAKNRFDT